MNIRKEVGANKSPRFMVKIMSRLQNNLITCIDLAYIAYCNIDNYYMYYVGTTQTDDVKKAFKDVLKKKNKNYIYLNWSYVLVNNITKELKEAAEEINKNDDDIASRAIRSAFCTDGINQVAECFKEMLIKSGAKQVERL